MDHPSTTQTGGDLAPEWESIGEQVVCPLCGYDLRGLVEPRCPECGYAFTWEGLFEARRAVHPYLFEHHPERNAWSFMRTLMGGVRPWRFWGTLTAGQPVRQGRLVVYWLVVVALTLPLVVVPRGVRMQRLYMLEKQQRSNVLKMLGNIGPARLQKALPSIIQQYGSLQGYIDSIAPAPTVEGVAAKVWRERWRGDVWWVFYAAWPLMTAGVLMVYRRSTRRAAIRFVQVWRCTVYSAGVAAWAGLAVMLVGGYILLRPVIGLEPADRTAECVYWLLEDWAGWLWLVMAGVMTGQLTVAYQRYLKMRWSWVAVPLAQMVVVMLYCLIYLE